MYLSKPLLIAAKQRLSVSNYKGANAASRRNSDLKNIRATELRNNILRTSSKPFNTPSINSKLNESRYITISAILREYIKVVFRVNPLSYIYNFSSVFALTDTWFGESQRGFCENSALYFNWFKIFALSGRQDQGDIPNKLWLAEKHCPAGLEDIISLYEDDTNAFSRRQLIRALLSVLSMYKVLTVPTAPSLESITSPFSGDDESGETINLLASLENLGINIDVCVEQFKVMCANSTFHESMAAGPNGHAV